MVELFQMFSFFFFFFAVAPLPVLSVCSSTPPLLSELIAYIVWQICPIMSACKILIDRSHHLIVYINDVTVLSICAYYSQ